MKAEGSQKQTVSATLADFALDAVPADLVKKAKGHMLDGLGIAIASSGFDFARPILNGAKELGSGTEAHALASGAPLPSAGAALVNGTLIHGLDFDDTTSARSITRPRRPWPRPWRAAKPPAWTGGSS